MHTTWGWAELLLLKAQQYIEFSIAVKFSCGTYHGVAQDFILGAVKQEEEQKVLQGAFILCANGERQEEVVGSYS